MKTIKKWTALALCLALFCALLPQISITAHAETLSGSIGDNVKWTLDTDTGLLTIDGEGDIRSNWDTDEDLPWQDDELSDYVKSAEIHEGITGTGGALFAGCKELSSVSLPNSLKNIGQSAFWGCTALTEITIPENVDTICESAFRACYGMTAIRVAPENEYFFSQDGVLLDGKGSELLQYPAGKKDASYQIPDTVMIIGPYAFSECTRLTELVIPDSVTELGYCMCEYNTALQKVAIGSGVTEIPAAAFIYCPALTEVRMSKGLTCIGSYAFAGCQSLTEVTIPNTVNEIYYCAFSVCEALKYVTIPDSVKYIEEFAFFDCAMTEVTIPASVTTIETYAFGYRFGDEDEYYYYAPIEDFTIRGEYCSAAYRYAKDNGFNFVSLSGNTVFTGTCGFSGDELTWSFDMETGLLNISGNGAMADYDYMDPAPWNCFADMITDVNLEDGVTRIGEFAFYYCEAVTNVTLPDSLTGIGRNAFYVCRSLTNVTLPNNLTEICAYAFDACEALTGVTIPDSVTYIGEGAFLGCTSLTDVTLPDSLTSIERAAFYYCINLTNVDIPEGVTTIGDDAFSRCFSLTNVNIPEGVTTIGEWAFMNCTSMTSVRIPASVTTIGDMAFGYGYQEGHKGVPYLIEGFTVYGYSDSAAATYAAENGIRFIAMDRFVDVTSEDYYFNPVMWAIGHEPAITNGVDDTHFGADNACTREQIVTFLWAANGKPAPTSTESSFSDVDSNAWYCKAVMWAVENKIAKGMEDGTFGVGQPCTRAQAMTFLWAANGKPAPTSTESSFSDVTANDWFCNAVLWAAENGITKGIGDGLFGSNSTCTRAQIITFLYKAAMMN